MARGLLGVAIAVLITLAVAASSAAAANLSAAPAGDGTPPCPIADPCDLATALAAAAAGDVVSALPGTYAVASVTVGAGVTLQGPGSGPPAVIAGDGSGVAAIVASGPEARVRDLTVTQRDFAAGVEIAAGALGDRLAVTASGAGAACSVPIGGLVRNSLCRALGGGNGVLVDEDTAVSGGSRIVNVTAVSSSDEGVGAALLVRSSLGANLDVEATNTIAASLGAAPDIAVGALAGSTADLQLERSNYATLALVGGTASATEPGTGGNQEAEPSFTGASSGDFRRGAGLADDRRRHGRRCRPRFPRPAPECPDRRPGPGHRRLRVPVASATPRRPDRRTAWGREGEGTIRQGLLPAPVAGCGRELPVPARPVRGPAVQLTGQLPAAGPAAAGPARAQGPRPRRARESQSRRGGTVPHRPRRGLSDAPSAECSRHRCGDLAMQPHVGAALEPDVGEHLLAVGEVRQPGRIGDGLVGEAERRRGALEVERRGRREQLREPVRLDLLRLREEVEDAAAAVVDDDDPQRTGDRPRVRRGRRGRVRVRGRRAPARSARPSRRRSRRRSRRARRCRWRPGSSGSSPPRARLRGRPRRRGSACSRRSGRARRRRRRRRAVAGPRAPRGRRR